MSVIDEIREIIVVALTSNGDKDELVDIAVVEITNKIGDTQERLLNQLEAARLEASTSRSRLIALEETVASLYEKIAELEAL